MAYHPRENWNPAHRRRVYTRRDFLQRAVVLGVALPALPTILAACGDRGGGSDTADLVVGTPSNPVEQPLFDDNPAIESGLDPEEGPLKLYNWEDYINPEIIPIAAEALGVEIEEATFFNEEDALARMASGEVQYDVWFPTSQRIAVAVASGLIQPLNHDYLPNMSNVWPQMADPYYDQGARYSAPYVLYSTGIGWRNDMVDSADIEGQANPWDVFWNPDYAGTMGLLDSFTDTIAMALFRNGVADPSQATDDELVAAGDALVELIDLMNVRYTIDGAYVGIPEGRFGLHHAWSGDLVNSAYYWPNGEDLGFARYLWPASSEGSTVNGPISNDTMAIPTNAERPVLAHQFINFMLDAGNALTNFEWLGYQPPQNDLTPDYLIENEYAAEELRTALVVPEDFERETVWVQGPLDAETEAKWAEQWTRATSGG
jgi:spermidine/putrescine transport system substrate-binding protein